MCGSVHLYWMFNLSPKVHWRQSIAHIAGHVFDLMILNEWAFTKQKQYGLSIVCNMKFKSLTYSWCSNTLGWLESLAFIVQVRPDFYS